MVVRAEALECGSWRPGAVPGARPATGEQVVAAQVLTSSSSSCPPPAHFSHCPPAPKLFAQELLNFLLHHLPTLPSESYSPAQITGWLALLSTMSPIFTLSPAQFMRIGHSEVLTLSERTH